ncbi:hypothetical protein SLEP1_g15827 [Rubroshorea leprosula]|uniref:Ribosomal protein L16 n=1 Tax=Rubroshorea leprosula TaxID=152421 RepID=A0AAV5IWF4_9ROSI|nr:hypothetical protein SLEP1_g15827 [Rubroshorea leprosula]
MYVCVWKAFSQTRVFVLEITIHLLQSAERELLTRLEETLCFCMVSFKFKVAKWLYLFR